MPASYTVKNLSEVADSAPQFGLEAFQKTRFAHGDLETEQTGFTHHRIEANARPPFAHRHQRAEEVYVVLSGLAASSSTTRSWRSRRTTPFVWRPR